MTSGYGRVKLLESAPWSRATSAAASGPGRAFAILGRRADFDAVSWAEAAPTGPSLLMRVRRAMISGAVIGSHNEPGPHTYARPRPDARPGPIRGSPSPRHRRTRRAARAPRTRGRSARRR